MVISGVQGLTLERISAGRRASASGPAICSSVPPSRAAAEELS